MEKEMTSRSHLFFPLFLKQNKILFKILFKILCKYLFETFLFQIFSNDDLACLEQSDDVEIEFAARKGLACRLKKVVFY
jgi:hypothetical protein